MKDCDICGRCHSDGYCQQGKSKMSNDTRTVPESIEHPQAKPKDTIDFEQVNTQLLASNQACLERTVPLVRMLGICLQQFQLYAENHRAKGTEEGDQKAQTNEALVKQIDDTLKEFRDRAEPQEQEIPE